MIYESGLINGRGRWNDNLAPLTTFTVTSGARYKFRVVGVSAFSTYRLHIDEHVMTVTSLDGSDVVPFDVDSLVVASGERFDIEVAANQPPANYWIRATTLFSAEPKEVLAILAYNGTSPGDPLSSPRDCVTKGCVIFGCISGSYADNYNISCLSLNDVNSSTPSDQLNDKYRLSTPADFEHFFSISFLGGPSINGRNHEESRSFLFSPYDRYEQRCNDALCDTSEGCMCSNIVTMPFNKSVQIVLTNILPENSQSSTPISPHPLHLHGHNFAVLKVGFPTIDPLTGIMLQANQDITYRSHNTKTTTWASHNVTLRTDSVPIKDTVVVPVGGYVVIRYVTDNPGYWMVHCHYDVHALHGMALVINEAPEHHPPIPINFPMCNDFDWSSNDYESYVKQASSRSY